MNYIGPNHRPDSIGLQRQYETSDRSLALADDADQIDVPDDSAPVWFCIRCNAGNGCNRLRCVKCRMETIVIANRKA